MENPVKNNSLCASIPVAHFLAARRLQCVATDATSSQDNAQTAQTIASLTSGLARGDEMAFRHFYELYFNRLSAYLLVLTRDEEAAREALQLTLIRVAKYAKRFDSEERFWSWLTVLARSSVADEQRKAKRYLFFLTRFFEHQSSANFMETDANAQWRELLDANLCALDEGDRALIRKKYFEGESVREIANESGSTEKAVESRLTRARRRLKELILTQLKHER